MFFKTPNYIPFNSIIYFCGKQLHIFCLKDFYLKVVITIHKATSFKAY